MILSNIFVSFEEILILCIKVSVVSFAGTSNIILVVIRKQISGLNITLTLFKSVSLLKQVLLIIRGVLVPGLYYI